MPNHVFNKIEFEVTCQSQADKVFNKVCRSTEDGLELDFETLIPIPIYVYRGGVKQIDEEDFPCWYKWNIHHWGTKWNAYRTKLRWDIIGKASIEFQTAWSVPYPFIVAFANTFKIPFVHKYLDEGSNYWGIETWGFDEMVSDPGVLERLTKEYKKYAHYRSLYNELRGESPRENYKEDPDGSWDLEKFLLKESSDKKN